MHPFSISHLRDRPEFSSIVADRIWNAWWRPKGYPLEYIATRVEENLAPRQRIPFAIVAHADETFLGTASIIPSDMEERPQYSPWIAAVWVEAHHRKRRIGSKLVRAAADAAFAEGFDRLYLCASPLNTPFYERIGWSLVEPNIGGHNVLSLAKR